MLIHVLSYIFNSYKKKFKKKKNDMPLSQKKKRTRTLFLTQKP